MHITVVRETKFKDAQCVTTSCSGFNIMTAAAASVNCGGLSLLWKYKEEGLFRLENQKVMGPNVIRFEFVTGKPKHGDEERYFVVGCYIPLLDKDGTTRRLIKQTTMLKPKGVTPLIMDGLNAHLGVPRGHHEELLSDLVGTSGYVAS